MMAEDNKENPPDGREHAPTPAGRPDEGALIRGTAEASWDTPPSEISKAIARKPHPKSRWPR